MFNKRTKTKLSIIVRIGMHLSTFIIVPSTGNFVRCAALSIHGDRRDQSQRPNQTEGDRTKVGAIHSLSGAS